MIDLLNLDSFTLLFVFPGYLSIFLTLILWGYVSFYILSSIYSLPSKSVFKRLQQYIPPNKNYLNKFTLNTLLYLFEFTLIVISITYLIEAIILPETTNLVYLIYLMIFLTLIRILNDYYSKTFYQKGIMSFYRFVLIFSFAILIIENGFSNFYDIFSSTSFHTSQIYLLIFFFVALVSLGNISDYLEIFQTPKFHLAIEDLSKQANRQISNVDKLIQQLCDFIFQVFFALLLTILAFSLVIIPILNNTFPTIINYILFFIFWMLLLVISLYLRILIHPFQNKKYDLFPVILLVLLFYMFIFGPFKAI